MIAHGTAFSGLLQYAIFTNYVNSITEKIAQVS